MTLTLDAAGKVQLEDCDLDVLHAEAGGTSNRIDGNWGRSQCRQNSVHKVTGRRVAGWRWSARFVARRINWQSIIGPALVKTYDRAQYVDHIFRLRDERCTAFDETVRALGARVERMSRKREYLAPEIVGIAGGDERARSHCRFDDHDPMH